MCDDTSFIPFSGEVECVCSGVREQISHIIIYIYFFNCRRRINLRFRNVGASCR